MFAPRVLGTASVFLALGAGAGGQTLDGVVHLTAQEVNQSYPLAAGCHDQLFTISDTSDSPPNCGTSSAQASVHRVIAPGLLATAFTTSCTQATSGCVDSAATASHCDQLITFTDVVFRKLDAPGVPGFVQASCNLEYTGTFLPPNGANCFPASASISVFGTGFAAVTTDAAGSWNGVLAGYANDGSTFSFTTKPSNHVLEVPVSLTWRLTHNWGVTLCNAFPIGSSQGSGSARLSCSTSGPVFNLPAGYTVDSAQLGIVDNQWVGVTLVEQPQDVVQFTGGVAQMNAVATGAVTSYAWTRDGVLLADGPTGTGSVVSGSATGSLTLSNVSAADAGDYVVTAVGACGQATSAPATLSVLPCGFAQYGLAAAPGNTIALSGGGAGAVGTTFVLRSSNVTGSPLLTLIALAPAHLPVGDVVLLVDPQTLLGSGLPSVPLNGVALDTLSIPPLPALTGGEVHFQSLAPNPTSSTGHELSNGLKLRICPLP